MIRIKRSTDNQFYFTIIATNGKVLVTSETYANKRNCKNGIGSLLFLLGISKDIELVDETL